MISHCPREQVPQLSALCVKEDGTVGEDYRHAVSVSSDVERLNQDQLDDHAASTRLEYYRFFGAELPPGGGEPTLTSKAKASRDWKKAQFKKDEPPKLCPSCYVALPKTSICDSCA